MVTIPDNPVIQPLNPEWYGAAVQQVDMLRLDAIHPHISGNKWYKLKYNIAYAKENGCTSLLTFGGGYSNHLAATAAAAKAFGIKAIGVIRGVYDKTTPTLDFCKENGMHLHFIPREEYAHKNDPAWLQSFAGQFGMPYIIPEGGANEQGRKGAEGIAGYIPEAYTHICVSMGTGTTLAGICNGLENIQQTVYGYAPMKGGKYLADELAGVINAANRWTIFDEWHFGGFGKHNADLVAFMNSFFEKNNIPLDIVYTGKMMYGVQQQIQAGFFPPEAKILCIHTGGLQGNASVGDKLVYYAPVF